ncbi:MAG: hypothetical protein PHR45_00730 [Muribaculaceae bacterium]|nr:hypothetical protein [Muribaculaceae bacterium]
MGFCCSELVQSCSAVTNYQGGTRFGVQNHDGVHAYGLKAIGYAWFCHAVAMYGMLFSLFISLSLYLSIYLCFCCLC